MTICKYVYYDIDGNPSPVYYETLKKDGHEAALKAYIEYMLSTNAKFSTDSMGNVLSVDELVEKSAKLRLSADETQYLDENTGNLHNRVTDLKEKLKTEPDADKGLRVQKKEFDVEGIALDQARRYIEKKALLLKNYAGTNHDQLTIDRVYNEYMATQEEDYLEQIAQTQFKDKWEASAKWGEYFHAIMQQYIIEYNKQVLDVEKATGLPKIVSNTELLKAARKTLRADKKFKSMVDLQVDNMNVIAQNVLNQIDKIIKQETVRYGEAPGYRLLPELKLSSDTVPGKPAGTADLVLITNNGNAYVFDFKTKSEESARNMNRVGNGKFGGVFESENLFDTPANAARVQMAYYAAILEENGYKVPQTYTILLPGDMARTTTNQSKGELEWVYLGMRPKDMEIIPNANIHHLLQEDTESTKAMIEQKRSTGIDKFVLDLASKDDMINLLYTRDNSAGYIARKKAQINTDARGNKFFNRDNPNLAYDQRRYMVGDKTNEEIEEVLASDYKLIKEEQKHLANNVIQFFNVDGASGQHNLKGRERITANLLGSVNKNTHTLVRADRYHPSLADVGADVLVAENRLTGAISLFSVMPVLNSSIKFSTDKSDKRTTVFGKYANDKAVRASGTGSDVIEQNFMHDFASMKLGLAALRLKSLTSKPLLIEDMKVASIVASEKAGVTTTYMPKEISKLKMVTKFAPKEDIPQFVTDLIDKPSNTAMSAYGFAFVEHLKKLLAERQGNFSNKGIQEIGRIAEEKLATTKNGELVSYETKVALSKFRNEAIGMLGKLYPRTDVSKLPEILAIDKAIVEMNEYNINTKQLIRGRVSRELGRTAMGTGDALIERSQVLVNVASANIRKEFKSFYDEHNEVLRNLVLENGGEKTAFALIMEDPNFTPGNEKNWMKLKDVSDPTLRDKPEARAYIEFFNDSVTKYYTKILPSNKIEGFKNEELWSKGLIPVTRAHKGIFESKSYESLNNWTDAITQNIKSMQKASYDPQLANDYEFTGADKFSSQVGNEGVQHSQARADALGITNNTRNIVPKRDVETNLAAVLINLAVTTSEAEHMGNILAVHDALYNVIESRKSTNADIEADSTVEFLNEWTKMVIENKYGKETSEPITRAIDQIGKMASTVKFSANIQQAAVEAFTGTFQLTSSMIANAVTGLVSKGKTVHYYPKDILKAIKYLESATDVDMQSKGFQIMYDMGMTYADSAQLKQKEWYSVGRAKTFKTRHMMYLNQLFFTGSITMSAMSEVVHKGVDVAYVNVGTDKAPSWKYDETLDPRFYVYDATGKIPNSKDVEPSTDADKKKYALWKAVREDLDKEGMIGEKGEMLIPFTANELTSMKFYATKLYGSYNKDKTTMAEKTAVGRAMLRYKGWFQQKASNYWTPTDMSISRGEFTWKEDPELEEGGHYEWRGLPNEGILESVGALMREIASFKKPNLTPVQLENLGKLFADLLLFLAMLAPLIKYLQSENKEFFKSATGTALLKAYTNASSDLAIWNTTKTMGDTMFPGIDMAITTAGNALTAATSMIIGDQKAAMQSFQKVPKSFGLVTTYSSAAELIGSAI